VGREYRRSFRPTKERHPRTAARRAALQRFFGHGLRADLPFGIGLEQGGIQLPNNSAILRARTVFMAAWDLSARGGCCGYG